MATIKDLIDQQILINGEIPFVPIDAALRIVTRILQDARERVTEGLRGIDTDHSYIHEGILFTAFNQFTLDAAGVGRIVLTTPADKYIHYRNEKVSTSGDKVTIELFEAPTVTAATGTAVTPINQNRICGIVARVGVLIDPTVTAEGTKIGQAFIGGGTGTGQARSGADTAQNNEIVLKRSTQYLVKITNGSSNSNIIQVNPIWYEEGSA
jgi:hypothetical protein